MKYNGTSWVYVGTQNFSAAGATYTSLAIDPYNTPYIAYNDAYFAYGNKATVMKYNGSSWVAVGSPGMTAGVATYISLAIDGGGTPYIAFADGANSSKVTVMEYAGSSWSIVGSAGFSAGSATYVSLAIDGNGSPYVAYSDGGNSSKATVMKYDGSSWATVGSAGFTTGQANYTSIAIDGSNNPNVSFSDVANSSKATVMKYNGSSWAVYGAADFSTGTANYASLAIDAYGIPIVAMQDAGTGSKAFVMKAGPATTSPTTPTVTATLSTVTCGNPTTLSASGTLNGADAWYWYSGSCGGTFVGTGNSISVSPTATTTYYARGEGGCLTTPGSCSSATTITVTAGAPFVASITGSSNACIGVGIALSDATSGGVWSSSSTAKATVDPSTGVVTGVATGSVTISYTFTNACGTTTKTLAMTVNTSPAAITGTMNACEGATSTLNDATASGTWTSNNTTIATVNTSTKVVSGVTAGTAIISYTLSTGCYDTTTFTVKSAPSAIAGNTSVCVGATTALSNTVSGGVWSSGTTTMATISTSGVVSGVAAGTPLVGYKLGDGCATSITITVNPNPAAITGTTNACEGATSTLNDATTLGTWTSSNTSTATVNTSTKVVTGVTAGSTTISYTLSTGCYATTAFTVNNTPAPIVGNTTVCALSTTTLSDNDAGGTWASSATGNATVGLSTGVVNGVASGSPTITYTLADGCIAGTTVTVNPIPAAITGTTNVCTGATSTLNDATASGTWTSSNTSVATVNTSTKVVSGITAGTSTISYTLATGCGISTTFTVNQAPSALPAGTVLCMGFTTTLSDGFGGGTWSSSATTHATVGLSTGIVTPVAAGATTITYSLPGSCTTITSATVNTSPSAITGPTGICTGSTITLSDVTASGTWTSSNTSVATVATTTRVVTPVSVGTSILSYTLVTGCYDTATITVYQAPSSILGATTVCTGFPITLSDAITGGTWSSSATTKATITSTTGVLTAVAAGSTNISYTMPGSCAVGVAETVSTAPTAITGPTSVCNGSTATLSDVTASGTWTSSNTSVATVATTTRVVSSVSAGTAIISYTLATGCYDTSIFTVNAQPTPITDTTTVCLGSTTILTNSITGGTWSSSATTKATINSSTGLVTPVAVGTTTITYIMPGGCSTTTLVTVSATPSLTGATNSGPICAGATLTLTASGSSNVTGYLWSGPVSITSPTSAIATVSTSSTAAAGTYTVTVNNGSGAGCFVNYTTTATVKAMPSAAPGSNSPICTGATVTLSANPGSNTSIYKWVGSNLSSTTLQNPTATPTSTSTYSLTVTDGSGNAGCSPATVYTTAVTVNTLPTAAPTNSGPACSGGSVTLFANPGGSANTYTWSGPNLSSTTAQNPTATPSGLSVYSLTVSYGTGNPGCSPSTIYTTTVTISSINIWQGTVSTDWNTAGNWCGGIPTYSVSVTIPSGVPHYPLVSTGTAIAQNITIQSGASLTESGGTLQINGNISNSGTFTASAGTVEMNGTSAQSISGSTISFYNLTNSNTSAPLAVNTNINVSGTLNMNGSATILTPSVAAVINSGGAAGTISGTGTIQVTRIAATADYVNQYKFSTNTLTSMTVDYTGAGAQTINSTVGNYGSIKTSTSGTKTLAGAITLNNNLTIGSGTTLDVSTNNYQLNVGGNWANNGTFNSQSGNVYMTGTATGLTLTGAMTGTSKFHTIVFLGGSSAAWSFGANAAEIGGTFNVSTGTVTAPSTTLTAEGNWYNGATFSNNSGTVIFSQTFTGLLINGNMTGTSAFYNVTFIGSGGAWSCGANFVDVANNFTITSGTVTAPSTTLQVYGNWSNSGTFTHNGGVVYLNKSGGQTISGSTAFNSLSIGASSTTTITASGQTVSNTLLCDGTLNAGGYLTLLSTATQTALIDGSGAGEVLGNVTMQRYLTHGYGYKYIGSPFTSATVGSLSAYINLSATFPTFYSNNENLATAGWVADTARTNTLTPLQGYAANFGTSSAALTYSLTGVVNNHTISSTLYNHNQTFTLGFNLVSNPYPSPINWTSGAGWTKTNIDNAVYYFNASDTSQYTGSYSSYIGGVSSDGIANNIIPAMQGFFIHVSSGTYPVTGTFSVNNSARVNNLTPTYHKVASGMQDLPLLRLDASFSDNGTHSDPAVIYFDGRANGTFDNTIDALKLLNTDTGIPSLYSFTTDVTKLSIQAINPNGDSINVIPLGLQTQQDGPVTFTARNIDNIPSGTHIYFYDLKTGINQDLQSTPQYLVNLNSGTYDNRFFLMLTNKDKGQIPVINGALNAYTSGKSVFVYLLNGTGNIVITDLLGQVIEKQEVSGNGYHEIKLQVSTGIYIVTLYSDLGKQSKKIFIGN